MNFIQRGMFSLMKPSVKKHLNNLFNEAFFGMVGQTGSNYDADGKTYIESGYNVNSNVYSIIQQQARKTADVPYFIKKVEDHQKARQFGLEIKRGNTNDPQTKQFIKSLGKKAFSSNPQAETLEMPIAKPNIFQSWSEFFSLYKTFLKLNGNVYIYQLMPEEGANAGIPIAFYLLPSHLMNIVLKPGANMLLNESPVDYYTLIYQNKFIQFTDESVIHIKYSNPNFDLDGSHLYGQSPLRAALKNIESSNEGMNQNIKTLKNSGVYGFIHGKSQPITPDQAKELKDRLMEMDANPERLSRIAGVSAEMAFTRLSLTTDELKPFEYLAYDKKELSAVLNWEMIDSTTSDYGGTIKEIKKQRIVDDIMPDLDLLEMAFNENVLPKYKGYENTMIYFDASTLPEMQADMKTLVSWLSQALADKTITRNEYREAMNYGLVEDKDFDEFEDQFDMPYNLAIEGDQKKSLKVKAGFDPNQPRTENGEWGSGGAVSFKEKTLYRGDTYCKGTEFNNETDYANHLGSAKNKGGYFFFTDNYEEAKEYANTSMNENIRTNKGSPNITTIKANGDKFLDLSKGSGANQVFNIISDTFFDGNMSFNDYLSLHLGSPKALQNIDNDNMREMTRQSYKKAYDKLSSGENVSFNLQPVDFSNSDVGVYFKKLLKSKGYDGYLFVDSMNGNNRKHYAFLDKKNIKYVSNEGKCKYSKNK